MSTQGDATNYYEILEVQPDSPPHVIHKAYQRAKTTYSADNPALYSMFSAEEAEELLRLIEEAYLVLGNSIARKAYDEARSRGEDFRMRQIASAPPEPAAHVASAHQALPDFNPPLTLHVKVEQPEPAKFDPAVRPTASAQAAATQGMGRTSLSTYKVDEGFEAEFGDAGDWDGRLLQRVRLYKNVSIDRLSEVTRISRPYLMAVEANDYASLPAAVFVRGFVVQLARALGLNESKVAASYMKIFKAGGGK